ncbi:MAG: lactate utilization protein [Syntrophales bacterium]|nr:lactate utilization protein [Syntrophales bacterium]MDY0045769.1 lactate utilization protein [Syntrophales bacterium]
MERHTEEFWKFRLEKVKERLEKNNFDVFIAVDLKAAHSIVINTIIPTLGAKKISWGGSMTVREADLYTPLKDERFGFEVIDTFDKDVSREIVMERRRQALLSDLFITGSNAVTEDGKLVNLDMYGNRVAAITFGPRNVVIVAGRNKIVPNLGEAMARIKNYSAPANAMRLDTKTPCTFSSFCEDCKNSRRICNTWTITEKSFPRGRIKIVLVNQNLGL